MASDSDMPVSEQRNRRDSMEAQPRQRRGRGGLGRGLGALIPDSEAEIAPQAGRPLDILFPDLRGADNLDVGRAKTPRKRGGSARDLLEPPVSPRNVSRETSKGRRANGAKGGTAGLPDARTAELIAAEVVPTELVAAGAVPAEGMHPESIPAEMAPVETEPPTSIPVPDPTEPRVEANIVSRETIAAVPGNLRDTEGELQEVPGATFGLIRPDWIIPNLKQPRHVFDPDDLRELAASIGEVGVLQPIVLRRITDVTLVEEGQWERLREALKEQPEARYEIIMGERRWRASQMAGLSEIPAIIRTTEEDALLRDALIENLHRVQLNPLEEAAAYSQLMEDFACTQEELSKRVARSRPQIANTLRLLKLPPSVQRQVAAGVLSAGHARALLGLDSQAAMEAVAKRIVQEGLSVRATEEQVKFGKQGRARPKKAPAPPSPAAQRVADAVADLLETSVSVSAGAKRGKLIIEFADQSDLDRIAATLGASLD